MIKNLIRNRVFTCANRILFLTLGIFISHVNFASDIVEISPLTNKIVLIHFDDGSVTYPNDLKVNRLNVDKAGALESWTITSTDDNEFNSALNPVKIGRKSKGTEFVKDAPWGGQSFNPTSKPWASEHWFYLIFDKEMKPGKTYVLNTGDLAENGTKWNFVFDVAEFRSEAVHVNTLGYKQDAPKFGYIYQWMGSLGNLDLSEFANTTFLIYKKGEETPVKEGKINKRKSATNAETSQPNDTPNKNFLGAEVYECDFSDVTADGTYRLVVEGIGSSYPFKIGEDPVWEAYYNVARSLYHQRSGIRLAPPYTADGYIRPVNQNTKVTSDDGTSFEGKLLYSDYSYMEWDDANDGGTSKAAIRAAAEGKPLDVAGWYHDAGDWDGYYSHQRIPAMLMITWEAAPDRFADNELNIPESGNGIPDLIDEATWLIKFNYRLRKELMEKGYSDGGVGGARICADVFTEVEGNAESSNPSWKEYRHTVVTQADAFMTCFYAGEAAQLACILKRLGKNPEKFPVEMLDAVDFDDMSKDTVNWIKEAEEAYAWASKSENQPSGNNNYDSPIGVYKMYAAVNLFRLTGKEDYHNDAKAELASLANIQDIGGDKRWGAYTYLLCDNIDVDTEIQNGIKNSVINSAVKKGTSSSNTRACRWGGEISFPMLVGQATTPAVFETLIVAAITGEKVYEDVVHTTADYFLGTNPLHTTWITGVGPRPAQCGFHLDSRYNNNWVTYPGFIPYGPWSMAYGFTPYTWVIDGVSIQGGHGPWNKDWANFSMYPLMENWPGHERWNSNIHAPSSSENTIHQNSVYGAVTYGFVNHRQYKNSTSDIKVGSIHLNKSSIELNKPGDVIEIVPALDISNATFSALKWSSSDPRIAFVDQLGKVTGVTKGNCVITCSTLDESVSANCNVVCNWEETEVDSIYFTPAEISLFKGQSAKLNAVFVPENASNKFMDYLVNEPGIIDIDENGHFTALEAGQVTVTAVSVSGKKKAECIVTVNELTDYIVADFDMVIPVTTEPQPDKAQLYTPNGMNDIASVNPLKNEANPSNTVVKWNRSEGDWQLIGIVLSTEDKQDLSRFSQFQFKYFGKDIQEFFIQLIGTSDKIEYTESARGEDCWKLFAYDLSSVDTLKQFNVFVNKTGNPGAITCYFDDFQLTGTKADWFSGTTISETALSMEKDEIIQLTAEIDVQPFSWVSENPEIATVDQLGLVTAVGGGTTKIKAVPLYGETVECIVTVEGETNPTYEEEVFLDFETIKLDWTAGYGAFSWNTNQQKITDNPSVEEQNNSSKVYQWDRDLASGNKWGGYAIVLPTKNTDGWERISFQVYVSQPVSTIRMELFSGETSIGNYTLSNLQIPASSWTKVIFNLADMGIVNETFDKIQIQIAGGSDLEALTCYSDNFKFENGTLVTADDISANTKILNVYPNPAKNYVNIDIPGQESDGTIFSLNGETVMKFKLTGKTKLSLMHLKPGMYFIHIVSENQWFMSKLIILS